MNQEQLAKITPEAKDLMTQVYPETDARKLQKWLIGSTHAQDLIGELDKNTHDVKNAGISRLGILVEACANHHFRKDFDRDDRLPPDVRTDLGLKILETVAGGDKKKMAEIYNEGIGEVELAEGVNVFQIKDPASTALAEAVEEVVKDWVGIDSLQAELRRKEDLASGYLSQYDTSEGQLHEARQQIEKLQHQLGEAEKKGGAGVWDDERREEVKGIYEELPKQAKKPIDENLNQYINDSDQIKEVDKEETEAPQNLEVAYQSLLRKFEDLEGVDIDALRRLGLTNKVVAHLPQILRLKLDERRAEQARQRQTNKERKEVEGYFATHEVKIEVNKKDDIVVDDDWQANLDKAVGLGIEPLAEVLLLPVPTGLKDMTNLEFRLEQSGRISQTVLTSQKLTASPDLDARKSRLTVLALDGVEKPFLLVRQFQDGQEVFTLERSGEKIGDVKFNEQGGLVVSWKEMTAGEVLGASWGITNLCEETWGKDRGLKGLKLIAVAEAEAVPTEPVEPVKPAAVAPTGTVLEAESPAPEPEKPTVKPKEVPEIPDWLKNLESASSQEEEEKLPPRAQKTL